MRISRGLTVASILLLAAPLGLVAALVLQDGARHPKTDTIGQATTKLFEVKPGRFRGKLVETGSVWADWRMEVLVPFGLHANIRRIVPDGVSVKKGDFVCELDQSEMKSELASRLTAAREAQAAYEDARRAREAAENALAERTRQGSNADDKASLQLQHDLDQKRTDEAGKLAEWERAKDKVGEYPARIEDSIILRAPADGPVVLSCQGLPEDPTSLIKVGSQVSGRKRILNIFDQNRDVCVVTKIPRLIVERGRVEPGLAARVTFERFPGLTLSGVVESIAPLPDPGFRDIRYSTRVKLDRGFPGLRPWMMARVEIDLRETDNVLSVPLAAVVHERGQDRVAVKNAKGTFDWRPVDLGGSTGTLVEVVHGIQDGDLVAIKPEAPLAHKHAAASTPRSNTTLKAAMHRIR
jgi:multidrug efflux pump subunit AcrA (membrane-fusion protein)